MAEGMHKGMEEMAEGMHQTAAYIAGKDSSKSSSGTQSTRSARSATSGGVPAKKEPEQARGETEGERRKK